MPFDSLRWFVSRRPATVVSLWVVLLLLVVRFAPNLRELAAEGQAELLPENAESARAARILAEHWPNSWFESSAVLALHRPNGITDDDLVFAQELAERFRDPNRPDAILDVIGLDAEPEVVERLSSPDGTMLLLIVGIDESFVSPQSQTAMEWLEDQAEAALGDYQSAEGLELLWTGAAALGRDYMRDVSRTLDRAAIAAVFLLLGVLLAVYRSLFLALVPLLTIGVSLMVTRGVLAWMATAGWEISSLVELFLVVILFGCGTDYCLLLSWRFSENWNPSNPASAIRTTMGRVVPALVASGGTTVVGLMLMGTTRFKLFSSTGPSVSIGLIITMIASMSLTPALLLFLARYRPKAFTGLTRPKSGYWDALGRTILKRPWIAWGLTLVAMLPAALLGLRLTAENAFLQDTVAELPPDTPSVQAYHRVSEKFGPGRTTPLTIVLQADRDLTSPIGLAMIDDVSRLLSHQRDLLEVRSATQPLGSTAEFDPARVSARLEAIREGFEQLIDGAEQLREGLNLGAARIRLARRVGELTGQSILGSQPGSTEEGAKESADDGPPADPMPAAEDSGGRSASDPFLGRIRQATAAMLGQTPSSSGTDDAAESEAEADEAADPKDPAEQLLRELSRAAQGAGQLADGAQRAQEEIRRILAQKQDFWALDRLLITPQTIEENPELRRSFDAYIAANGRLARIDVEQSARPLSPEALDQVEEVRRRLEDFLGEYDEQNVRPQARISGANADAADIRAVTRRDQYQTWIIVPLGVFIVLVAMLREPIACINLVATMILTYAFALGVTHLVFVWGLGMDGLDWKVPYFLFVLLVAVGVDYNVFLMTRLQEETRALGLKAGITKAIGQTGGLITSAAAITACSFAAMMFSPLSSLQQLGFSLVVGIITDAALVRPVLVPCGQWLIKRRGERRRQRELTRASLSGVVPAVKEPVRS